MRVSKVYFRVNYETSAENREVSRYKTLNSHTTASLR